MELHTNKNCSENGGINNRSKSAEYEDYAHESNKNYDERDSKPTLIDISVLDHAKNARSGIGFPDNSISTSKYSMISFIPLNLFEQFRRISNFFFLTVTVLTSIPGASPITPASAIAPLVLVIGVSAVKDAYEDYKRHQSDSHANIMPVFVLRPKKNKHLEKFVIDASCPDYDINEELGTVSDMATDAEKDTKKPHTSKKAEFVSIPSEAVRVGDILLIRHGEEIRADCVLLNSSLPDGVAYIETSNLDGETNAKIRRALDITCKRFGTIEQFMKCNASEPLDSGNGIDKVRKKALSDVIKFLSSFSCTKLSRFTRNPKLSASFHSFDAAGVRSNEGLSHCPLNQQQSFTGIPSQRLVTRVLASLPDPNLSYWQGQLLLQCEKETSEGTTTVKGSENDSFTVHPLGNDQLLLRGSILRNTEYVYAVVVYTGVETKMCLNLKQVPPKRSKFERQLNFFMLILFFITLILVGLLSGLAVLWQHQNRMMIERNGGKTAHGMWYVQYHLNERPISLFGGRFISYYILLSSLIPISLLIQIEVNKGIQIMFIAWDSQLSHFENSRMGWKFCQPKTSDLTSQLAKVQYIFADKTGTLTENKMKFIGGHICGGGNSGVELLATNSMRSLASQSLESTQSIAQCDRLLLNSASSHPALGQCGDIHVKSPNGIVTPYHRSISEYHHYGSRNISKHFRFSVNNNSEILRDHLLACGYMPPRTYLTNKLCEKRMKHFQAALDGPGGGSYTYEDEEGVKSILKDNMSKRSSISLKHPQWAQSIQEQDVIQHSGHSRTVSFDLLHHRTIPNDLIQTSYPHTDVQLEQSLIIDKTTMRHIHSHMDVESMGDGDSTCTMNNKSLYSAGARHKHEDTCNSSRKFDFQSNQRSSYKNQTYQQVVHNSKIENTNTFLYLLSLAACNSVVCFDPPDDVKGKEAFRKVYEGQSLDEVALVHAAADNNFELVSRGTKQLTLDVLGRCYVYDIVADMEFTPQRKMMSIILKRNRKAEIKEAISRRNFFRMKEKEAVRPVKGISGVSPSACKISQSDIDTLHRRVSSMVRQPRSDSRLQSPTSQIENTQKCASHIDPYFGEFVSVQNREGQSYCIDPPVPFDYQNNHSNSLLFCVQPILKCGSGENISHNDHKRTVSLGNSSESPSVFQDHERYGLHKLTNLESQEAHRSNGIPRSPFLFQGSSESLVSSMAYCYDNTSLEDPVYPYLMLTKGADSSMLPLVDMSKEININAHPFLVESLEAMASNGFRTLVLGYCRLSQQEVDNFIRLYNQSQCSLNDRNREMHAAYETIEKGYTLIGATAVEDKLQRGVTQTLEFMLQAKIVVWILTGDKRETAVTIAVTTSLINPETTNVCHIDVGTISPEYCAEAVEAQLERVIASGTAFKEDKDRQAAEGPSMENSSNNGLPTSLALIIDGNTLEVAFYNNLTDLFFKAGTCCDAGVCCRMTPLQKADVVRLFQTKTSKVALAIGDGANDVSMIQEAEIGIGIMGLEGSQAVLASDFAIPKFRHLKRLMVVHGRHCLYRDSGSVQFSTYKNICLVVMLITYSFFTGFSAQEMFASWLLAGLNMAFCQIQALVIGILDKDVPDEVLESVPQLYPELAEMKSYFRPGEWISVITESAAIGLVLSFIAIGTFDVDDGIFRGKDSGLVLSSCIFFYTMVCLIDCAAGLRFIKSWNIVGFLGVFIGLLLLPLLSIPFAEVDNFLGESTLAGSSIIYSSLTFFLTLYLALVGILVIFSLTKFYLVDQGWFRSNNSDRATIALYHRFEPAVKVALDILLQEAEAQVTELDKTMKSEVGADPCEDIENVIFDVEGRSVS